MYIDQIYDKKVAHFWVSSLSFSSGLFGLFDLEISKPQENQSKTFKWTHSCWKNMKKWYFLMSGLWFGLSDLHWPFSIFCGLWSIISPVLYSSDINNPSIISKSYCWKFPILDHCDESQSVTSPSSSQWSIPLSISLCNSARAPSLRANGILWATLR